MREIVSDVKNAERCQPGSDLGRHCFGGLVLTELSSTNWIISLV
jgi:hypothetical protein